MERHVQAQTGALLLLLLFISGFTAYASSSSVSNLEHTSKKVSMLHDHNSRKLLSFVCGAPGPVCPPGVTVHCDVGGNDKGCICSLIHACVPDVSGCYVYNGDIRTSCGF